MLWIAQTIDDMNHSGSYAHGSRCYEKIRVVDNMNNYGSWAKGSKCYEQLRVVDEMNDSRSYEFRALDVMNNSEL